eukprot:GHVR01175902.1.p1 GENE.GHVR01175902.1~~GHVR01175902.1.p1  ORF type:complete len:183 (-),score=10.52 GHVR01175902.1:226-774(-)
MLTTNEKCKFNSPNVPLIAANLSIVQEENTRRLRNCLNPICVIKAVDTGINKGGPACDFNGLHPILKLCDGARVMLTRNIASCFRLVNGSFGFLRGLVYATHERNHATAPLLYALVEFDKYEGPNFFVLPGRERWVPIPRIDSEFGDISQVLNNRNQLPLMLAWAFTIHKSQGSSTIYSGFG